MLSLFDAHNITFSPFDGKQVYFFRKQESFPPKVQLHAQNNVSQT